MLNHLGFFFFFSFFFLFFSKVRVGAKEGGSHYWEMAVAITCGYGGYLLPLLAAHSSFSWWHHQMETFSVLLALCAGNLLVTGEFSSHRPVTWSFDVFFDLCLCKHMIRCWFEMPLYSLWHHPNVQDIMIQLCQLSWYVENRNQGFYSLKCRLTGIGIPIINLRRSDDRLRFIMGIPILTRQRLFSE